MFAQAGYGRATVEAVAERAEVSKGTIYLYFPSKESILADLLLEALAALRDRLQHACDSCSVLNPGQSLRAMAAAYLAFAQNSPDYYRLLNHYARTDGSSAMTPEQVERLLEESRRTLELVAQPIADGMEMGIFHRGDPRILAGVLWAAMNGALVLMSHPFRRMVVPADLPQFYFATVDQFLRSLENDCPATATEQSVSA